MGYWINPHHPLPGGHGIHHYPVEPVLKGVVHAGAAVKVHIQHLRCKCVLVLGLYDAVAALSEIGAGVLSHHLKCGIYLAIVRVHLPPSVGGLILKNQEEPAGQRFPAAFLPDKPDRSLPQLATGFHCLLLQVRLKTGHILIGIRFASHRFELQPHRGYFQPTGEGGDDAPLFLVRTEKEIDRFNLQNLEEPAVSGFDDSVFEFFEWDEVLDELQLFLWHGTCPPVFSWSGPCSCLCHNGIRSSYNEAAAAVPET